MVSKSDNIFMGGEIGNSGRTRSAALGKLPNNPSNFALQQFKTPVYEKVQGSAKKDVWGALATQLSQDIGGYLHEKAQKYEQLRRNNVLTDVQTESHAFAQEYKRKTPNGLGLTEATLKTFDTTLEEGIKEYSDDEKDLIRISASSMKRSIAKSYANEEKNLVEDFTVVANAKYQNALLNSLSLHPEQEPQLRKLYDANTDNLKGVVSASAYAKAKSKDHKEWVSRHGEALIDKDPRNWQRVLESERFRGADADVVSLLKKHGERQADRLEKKAYRERKLAEIGFEKGQSKLSSFVCKEIRKNPFAFDEKKVAMTGLKGKHLYDTQAFMLQQQKSKDTEIKALASIARALSVSELELGLEADTKDSADIQEYFADEKITETERNNLLKKYIHNGKTENKKAAAKQEIEEHIESETPAPLISTEHKNSYFTDAVQGKSLTDIIEYAKKNAIVFDANITSVKNACETSIMNGNDAKTVMDACVAIKDNENVPVIKGLDKDCVDFANLAVVMFKGDENVNNILLTRDEYFKHTDANVTEHRKKLWKESDYHKKPTIATDKFYGKNGFEGWFKSINKVSKPLLDAEVQGMVKRVYEKTGSFSKAEAVANEYVKNLLQVTNINGISNEYMINPPTPENTGFSAKQIDKLTDDLIKGSLVDLREAGEDIDILAIKREAKFIINGKKEKRKVYYEGVNPKAVQGNLYYLLNADDPNSREYLINPTTGRRAVVDFEKLKNIASNKLAGIK